MVVVSWTLNDHTMMRDLSWWICPHGDHKMAICMRCYHPFDFIYVELKRHRPLCPRWYSARHRRCVGYSPYSRLTHLFCRCSLTPSESGCWTRTSWPWSDPTTLIVLWRIGIACTGTVIGQKKRVHDATEARTTCMVRRIVGRAPRHIRSNTVVLRSSAIGIGI